MLIKCYNNYISCLFLFLFIEKATYNDNFNSQFYNTIVYVDYRAAFQLGNFC